MGSFDWSIIRDPTFHKQLRIPNPADRDDAIQDACLKLIKHDISPTVPLLRKTTLNKHKDHVKAEIRRRAREQPRVIAEVYEEWDWFDTDCDCHGVRMPPAQPPRATDYSPSSKLERRELRTAIKRALRTARLSRDHQCALWAWFRDHVAEFAKRRGIAEVTARVWAKRARDALRPHAEREGLGRSMKNSVAERRVHCGCQAEVTNC